MQVCYLYCILLKYIHRQTYTVHPQNYDVKLKRSNYYVDEHSSTSNLKSLCDKVKKTERKAEREKESNISVSTRIRSR